MGHELTKHDIEKMEQEIAYRKSELRPELLSKLKEARAQGDLSENFEYYAAKRENGKNNGRIRYLEKMIRYAKVVEENEAADEAGLGKTVTFEVEEDGETEICSIVSTVLSDPLNGRVSIESPIGKALCGAKPGDRVYIPVNDNFGYYVVIRKIEPFDDSDVPINRY